MYTFRQIVEVVRLAPFTIYIKNSDVTEATPVDWFQSIASLDPVVDIVLDVNNNFPGVEGWIPFTFDEPFTWRNA